ncbi:hypothetical protein L2E82_44830 [Cichorium intybus]|uniref:Uncharacterized protein n=1 Tax=Cichorium intybus TaxID=13427 RepID=A0ACB8ZSB1_CICIN|nr:hypothetical protein L2E82_44830 [Cichorium intybus]
MGASKSTGRLSGSESEEDERRPEAGGGSSGTATNIAIAIAGAAVAAWGISRMLSDKSDTEEEDEATTMRIGTHGLEPSLSNQRSRSYTGYTTEGAYRNGHVDRTSLVTTGHDANKCADGLVRLALKERNESVQYDIPDNIHKLVEKDKTACHSYLKT